MSSSRQPGIPLLTLLALVAPLIDASKAAQTQAVGKPVATDSGARDFLATLIAGKCTVPGCTVCNPAQQTNGESAATESTTAEGQNDSAGQAVQETLVASGGISQSACRAVRLTDADTGGAAQLKGSAAAFITCLEDLRDSLIPGSTSRMTAEGHIGAVAHACDWAVSCIPIQAA